MFERGDRRRVHRERSSAAHHNAERPNSHKIWHFREERHQDIAIFNASLLRRDHWLLQRLGVALERTELWNALAGSPVI